MSPALVVNPAAGNGKAAAAVDTIASLVNPSSIHRPTSPEDTSRVLRELVDASVERIVVAGGDGMVHLAVNALSGSGSSLGLVPVGSGNDFARGVGIPIDIEAASAIAIGSAHPLDLLATEGDGCSASVATAGFSVSVNRRGNDLSLGPVPESQRYTIATLLELPRLKPVSVQLRLDDHEPVEIEVTFLAVANTRFFGGGMEICPPADPTDGMLDIITVGPIGRLELLRFFPKVFKGAHMDHPAVDHHRAQSVELAGDGVAVWADGEPLAVTPTRIGVASAALSLAYPR